MSRPFGSKNKNKSYSGNTVEIQQPEVAAAVIDEATQRLQRVRDIAESCGLPESTVKALIKRLEARYQPLAAELKGTNTRELLELLDDRSRRALEYLDDFVLAGASAKDLAVTIGILLEKRQLLRGEPTQILSSDERRNLNELLPVVLQEARRRGITLEVDQVTGVVTKVVDIREDENMQFRDLSHTKGRTRGLT